MSSFLGRKEWRNEADGYQPSTLLLVCVGR